MFYRIIIMVYASLLTSILLATAAFAAPSSGLESRRRRRSQPLRRIEAKASTNTSNVEYSSNWAGAVWDSYPAVRIFVKHHIARLTSFHREHSLLLPALSSFLLPVPPMALHQLGSALTVILAILPSFRPVSTSPFRAVKFRMMVS